MREAGRLLFGLPTDIGSEEVERTSRRIAQDLHDAFGSQHQVSNEIKVKLSTEYDARLGYRVMEAVRNMMQHRSLPIHRLSYPQDSQPGGARFRTVPSMEVARLKEADLKGSLVQELDSMGKHVPVTPFVRDYVEGLATVHEGLRTASESQGQALKGIAPLE